MEHKYFWNNWIVLKSTASFTHICFLKDLNFSLSYGQVSYKMYTEKLQSGILNKQNCPLLNNFSSVTLNWTEQRKLSNDSPWIT